MHVHHRGQGRVRGGVRGRGDPRLDGAAGSGRLHAAHDGPGEGVDPGGTKLRDRRQPPVGDQAQLRGTGAHRCGHGHPAAAQRQGVREIVAVGQPQGVTRGPAGREIHGEAPRVRAPAIRDERHHAVAVPRGARVLLALPAGEVRVRPAAHGAVQVRGQRDGRGGSIGGTAEEGRRDVVEVVRVVHAHHGQPSAVRGVGGPGARATEREDLAGRGRGSRGATGVRTRRRHGRLEDGGPGPEIRVRPGIRRERQGQPVRPPADAGHAARDVRDAHRRRPVRGRHHERLAPPV